LLEGRKLVEAGDCERDRHLSTQLAWSKKSPNFSGIGYSSGNFSAAAAAYRQAVALDPNNANFHYALSYSLGIWRIMPVRRHTVVPSSWIATT